MGKKMGVQELIKIYGNTKEVKDNGIVLYRGTEFDYHGFGNKLTDDFEPLKSAFNGYREEYFSSRQKANVSLVEGDIVIVVCKDEKQYLEEYERVVEFYKNN